MEAQPQQKQQHREKDQTYWQGVAKDIRNEDKDLLVIAACDVRAKASDLSILSFGIARMEVPRNAARRKLGGHIV